MAQGQEISDLQSMEVERAQMEAKLRQMLSRIELLSPSPLPADKPRFGSSGFLDPALEYFIRNELEKLETRLKANIDTVRSQVDIVEARIKEHIEREFRKFIVWMIGASIAATSLTVTVAKYWVFPAPGK
jgi:hypothetical protein